MGDPRNWPERKVARVRAENAARDRDRLREVTFYGHSAAELAGKLGPDFLRMHPCDTFRVFRFQVTARCMGCNRSWEVKPHQFDDSHLAHRHWPYVIGELICEVCTSCPRELRFKASSGDEVGAISTETELTLHVWNGPSRPSRREVSQGMPDPGAQHDDSGSGSEA